MTEEAANSSIRQLKASGVTPTVTEQDMKIEYTSMGGEESRDLVGKAIPLVLALTKAKLQLLEANKIIAVLNLQADYIFQWRARIAKLLTESLSASEGENADGEEYARTLETQGEAEMYLQEYAALLADRREILVAERTALAAHDAREKRYRSTYAAAKAQQPVANGEAIATLDEDEKAPEHEVLEKELADTRRNMRILVNGRAVKSISVDLRGIATSISNNRDPERIIANEWSNRLKAIIKDQGD